MVGFKLVVFDDSNVFEFEVLTDVNKGNLQEVHEYLLEHTKEYPKEAKYMLLPICA